MTSHGNDLHTKPTLRRRDLAKANRNLNSDHRQHVKDIETCQKDLELLADKERTAKFALVNKYTSYLKPFFDSRSKIIHSIPNFWASVMEYHPKLSYLVNDQVVDILRHVTKLEMEYTGPRGYKLSLHFDDNPYIENKVITKEMCEGSSEKYVSKSTPIVWKNNPFQEKDCQGTTRKRKNEEHTFFDWFCNDVCSKNNFDLMDDLAMVWQNPFPIFFLMNCPAVGDDEILDVGMEEGNNSERVDGEQSDMEEEAGNDSGDDDSDDDKSDDSISSDSLGSEAEERDSEEEDTSEDDDSVDG